MQRYIFLAILLTIQWPATAALIVLDEIAAIVNDDVVMQSEVEDRMKAFKSQFARNGGQVPPDAVVTKQIIERLVIESLQLQMAERAGVRISDEELNQAMRRIAEQNRMTLESFQSALAQDGIPYADMREQIRNELKISRVQQGVMRNRIEISEQQVDNFLESELGNALTSDEYRLAHILLPIPNEATPGQIQAVRAEADNVLQRVQSGDDFQALAIEKSAGQNALEGGDLGWRKPAQLPTMFSDIAQEMKQGEVRGPIKSGSGFHLIYLLDKRGATTEGQIDQTRLRHVLIQPSEIRTAEESLELAETLREEVAEGRDFSEVARLFSDDPGSALSGGDLGWSMPGDFVPAFAEVMQNSDINELSPVFRSEFGFHFLEVTGRRVEDFSDRFKRNQAENFLRNQMFDEELETWLREIRDEAFVEVRI